MLYNEEKYRYLHNGLCKVKIKALVTQVTINKQYAYRQITITLYIFFHVLNRTIIAPYNDTM